MLFVELPRPCFLPEIRTDLKGKTRKIYRYEPMMTPYDKLRSGPRANVQSNPDFRFAILEGIAHQLRDTKMVNRLQKAGRQLFTTIHDRTQNAN